MGGFLLTVAVFLVLVEAVTPLKCYRCSGTEDDCKKSTLEGEKSKYLIDCDSSYDKCMRTFLKKDSATLVSNSCTNQLGCNQEIIGCGQYNDVTCKVSCCDEDACNVGSNVSFNVFLLTAFSILGLALLM
ncbi:uncharacterized protein LOC110054220 [Orbicella faveolata]|uniref:uncharacterized protein LOC110054220 n=1 Tax=Orbicella faveolata TaxID=48498 RepID=UPI0009E397F6|nr:uncharacterized protein LOC110054220 [Orbicella faveolata]